MNHYFMSDALCIVKASSRSQPWKDCGPDRFILGWIRVAYDVYRVILGQDVQHRGVKFAVNTEDMVAGKRFTPMSLSRRYADAG